MISLRKHTFNEPCMYVGSVGLSCGTTDPLTSCMVFQWFHSCTQVQHATAGKKESSPALQTCFPYLTYALKGW